MSPRGGAGAAQVASTPATLSDVSATRLIRGEDASDIATLLRENRTFLGRWHPRRSDRYFTEFWLAETAQGRGLATVALREAVGVAFGELRLHRIQAETLLDNARSQAALERVGFTRYGLAPSYLKIDGRWQDHLLFQLLSPQPDRVEVPD